MPWPPRLRTTPVADTADDTATADDTDTETADDTETVVADDAVAVGSDDTETG